MTDYICFDIETIPSQEPWVKDYYTEKTSIPTPPKSLKKQETIDAWLAENTHEDAVQGAIDKAGFDGATNHIVALSWSINNEPVKGVFCGADLSLEKLQLIDFFNDIRRLNYGAVFVGHNIVGFDTRIIKQRAMVLQVQIPQIFPVDAKPWDKNVYDTMLKWDSKSFVKMDLIAKAFGFVGKKGVDGSMVYPMWKEGRYEEIKDYCNDDVEETRQVYKRMTFQS